MLNKQIRDEQNLHFGDIIAQVQVWVAPLPFQSCVGAMANSRPMGTGAYYMTTDLGPVGATRRKKTISLSLYLSLKVVFMFILKHFKLTKINTMAVFMIVVYFDQI